MLRLHKYLFPYTYRHNYYIPNNILLLKCRFSTFNYYQNTRYYSPSHLYNIKPVHYSLNNKFKNNEIISISRSSRRSFSDTPPRQRSIIIRGLTLIVKFPFKLCKWTIQLILKPFKIIINLTTGSVRLFGKIFRFIGSGIKRSLRVAKAARQSGVVGLTRSVWNGIVHTVHWCKTGFKLYAANVRVSYFILVKKFKGHPLGYKEHKLLMRTLNDCFKLVPFSFFLIVPFAEFLLPVAIKLFPNMLPSTFQKTEGDTSYLHKKLLVKKELAGFFQELVQNHTNNLLQAELDSSIRTKAEALSAFQQRLMNKDDRDMNPFLTANELVVFSKILRHEFVLDKMSLETLQVMCKLLGIRPFALHSHVVLQLRHHLLKIQREDQMIKWEGVESLTVDELSEACRDRAMKFYDITKEQMQQNLNMWLDLSGRKEIPLILLLWSRCITMTHSPMEVKVDVLPPDLQKDEPQCKEEEEIIERQHQLEELLITEANLRESTPNNIEAESLEEEKELSKPELIAKFNQLNEEMELQKTITDKQEKILNEILAFILKVSESDGNDIIKLKDEASLLLSETNDSVSQLEELILKSKDDKNIESVSN